MPSKKNYTTLFIFFYFLFFIEFASSSQDISQKIPRIDEAIKIDGELDETSWENAYSFSNFVQLEPNLGQNATSQSVVKVVYDSDYLYIGCVIYHSNPKDIFAATLERDVSQSNDDYVEIHIDSYNDKINSLVFRTNPLSAREDYEVNRNGEGINDSWNTFWDVKSKVFESGWKAEYRIPFNSLRYQSKEINIMRIKAVVKFKANNELVISTLNNTDVGSGRYHFTNAKEVSFESLPSPKPIYITPYVKGNITSENTLNEDGTAYENVTTVLERKHYANNKAVDKILSNVGVDVKYKPNANNTLDFTINTDFAEIEADDRLINISRFPILLPEKRLFFLENADIFNSNMFDHRLFNSRAIGIQNGIPVPIIAGLRFTGGNKGWQYGLLDMQTHEVIDLTPAANQSVFRVKKNIGGLGSYIGILNTNKISNNNYNSLAAIDANFRLTNTFRLRLTSGVTFDKELGNWKPMYGAAVETFKNNGFGIEYRFREYTENFNPELGFVEQPNTKRLTLNHGWRKTYKNHSFLQYLSVGHYFRKNWLSNNGLPDFFQTNFYFSAIHKKGLRMTIFPLYQEDNIYSDWEISDGVLIPAGRYKMWKINPRFSSGNAKAYQYNFNINYGDFYGGNQFSTSFSLSYDFNRFFKAQFGGSYNHLKFPESYSTNTSDIVNLSRYFSRLKLNLSSKTAINSYFQYDTRSEKFGLNLRFRYNPIEGTDLFFVYNLNANTNRDSMVPELPLAETQLFILKFSKTILR